MQTLFREFIFILFYRSRIILTVFLAVFIISLIIAVTLPSMYRSTAKFSLILPQSFDPLQQETSYDYRNRLRRFLQEQKELVLSNRVLTKVIQELYPGTTDYSDINKKIDELREDLDVVPPGGETFEGSNVYNVDYVHKNPEWASKVGMTITTSYLEAYREMSRSKTNYSHSFFVDQVEKLTKEMKEKENNLRDFETRQALSLLEILNLGEGKTNTEVGPNVLLTQFLGNYHALQTELAGLLVSISSLERENNRGDIPVVLPEMEIPGRTISVFKNKVAQLQIQLNEMRPQFTENFEPMKQVEQEMKLSVDSLKKELNRSINAQKITAQNMKARIGQLEKTIRELRERIQTISKEKATYDSLKQEFNIAKDNYTRTHAQMEQARMAHSLNQDKQFMTLIDKPTVPGKPFKPNRLLIILGGLFAGLFMGITAALIVDHFDHRMKTSYEIERVLNIPVMGSIRHL
jgi:succinoglycan biosynthesis transport protein ExoP